MGELLATCWKEILDAGPYDFGENPIDRGVVLQGDRIHAPLQIRALTYGPTYAFAVNCQSESCRVRIEWEQDLAELPCQPLSEESRGALLAANRFETTLPDDGKRVRFRLFTGVNECKLQQKEPTI